MDKLETFASYRLSATGSSASTTSNAQTQEQQEESRPMMTVLSKEKHDFIDAAIKIVLEILRARRSILGFFALDKITAFLEFPEDITAAEKTIAFTTAAVQVIVKVLHSEFVLNNLFQRGEEVDEKKFNDALISLIKAQLAENEITPHSEKYSFTSEEEFRRVIVYTFALGKVVPAEAARSQSSTAVPIRPSIKRVTLSVPLSDKESRDLATKDAVNAMKAYIMKQAEYNAVTSNISSDGDDNVGAAEHERQQLELPLKEALIAAEKLAIEVDFYSPAEVYELMNNGRWNLSTLFRSGELAGHLTLRFNSKNFSRLYLEKKTDMDPYSSTVGRPSHS